MIKDKSVSIKNVYYMLSYAFQDLRFDEVGDIAGEEFERIHDLFAAILAKGVARRLKQGLCREYLEKTDDLATLRGKVRIAETLRGRLSRKHVLNCEYDELSENNTLNQVLKTTMTVLLRHGDVSEAHRGELRRLMPYFSTIDLVDPASIRWSSIRYSRTTVNYRALMTVCQLVLDGMLLTDERGEMHLMTYLKPQYMARLFEKFILGYYRTEWSTVDAT